MAIGYALANSIMIEGKDEIVIVDVTESYETGQAIMSAFRNITKKPVAAIVYTHNHADHTYGAKVTLSIYCIQGYFRPVFFSSFYCCKRFTIS